MCHQISPRQTSSMEFRTVVLGCHGQRCWLRGKCNLTVTLTKTGKKIVVHLSVGRTDRPTDVTVAGAFFGLFLTFIDRAQQKTVDRQEERSPARIKMGALRLLYKLCVCVLTTWTPGQS